MPERYALHILNDAPRSSHPFDIVLSNTRLHNIWSIERLANKFTKYLKRSATITFRTTCRYAPISLRSPDPLLLMTPILPLLQDLWDVVDQDRMNSNSQSFEHPLLGQCSSHKVWQWVANWGSKGLTEQFPESVRIFILLGLLFQCFGKGSKDSRA